MASLCHCHIVFFLALLEPLTASIYILSSHSSVITDTNFETGSKLGHNSWAINSFENTKKESCMQVLWGRALGKYTSKEVRK